MGAGRWPLKLVLDYSLEISTTELCMIVFHNKENFVGTALLQCQHESKWCPGPNDI